MHVLQHLSDESERAGMATVLVSFASSLGFRVKGLGFRVHGNCHGVLRILFLSLSLERERARSLSHKACISAN
jgi:hypothetical protein